MPQPGEAASGLNVTLLEALRAARGIFIPLNQLGDDLEKTRADLASIVRFGFTIEDHPYLGVRYIAPAERLCPDQIEHRLDTRLIGRRIAVWERVASTNDLAVRACGSSRNDGLIILAEEQTQGRGRTWVAPARTSILMSVVLFPPSDLAPAAMESSAGLAWLTALAAVATVEVVEQWTGRAASIKWPNDVRVARRKIAGILVEREPRGGALGATERRPVWAVVIGIGLNVNLKRDHFPEELRELATSIQIERGDGLLNDRSALVHDLIRRLDYWYDTIHSRGIAPLNDAWRARLEHLERLVNVDTPTGRVCGRVVDIDLAEGLTLEIDGSVASGRPGRDRSHIALAEILGIDG
jgi:BirA family biotin operon repressor/biotin-[acetyl-CoA-carboxylase] ligase